MTRFINLCRRLFGRREVHATVCPVCGKPISALQRVTRVNSGETMHSDCWPEFFDRRVEDLRKQYSSSQGLNK